MDTRPSMCPVAWKMPVNRSQASRTSSVVTSPDGVVHGGAAGGQLVELFLVGRAVLQCGLEDRWVGGDPADVPGVNQVLEVPGVQALTGEVIEPQGHPLRGQSGKSVSHWCSPFGVRFLEWLKRGTALGGCAPGRVTQIRGGERVSRPPLTGPDRRCRCPRVPAVSSVGSRSQAPGGQVRVGRVATRRWSTRPRRWFRGSWSSCCGAGVMAGGVRCGSRRRPLPARPR